LTAAAVVTFLVLTAVAVEAGAVGGRRSGTATVAPYGIDRYYVTFRGGEHADVVAWGDHGTDLDLYVYDEYGNLIALDDDPSDECAIRFVPRWTGSFTICIVNRGPFANQYVLMTN